MLSINYINDKTYIGNEIYGLHNYTLTLQRDLQTINQSPRRDTVIKYLTYSRGDSKTQITTYVKKMLTYNKDCNNDQEVQLSSKFPPKYGANFFHN